MLKAVVAQYNADQLLTMREKVSRQINDTLTQRAKNFHLVGGLMAVRLFSPIHLKASMFLFDSYLPTSLFYRNTDYRFWTMFPSLI